MRGFKVFLGVSAVALLLACPKEQLDRIDPPYCPPGQPNCGCLAPWDDCHAPTDPCDRNLFNACPSVGASKDGGTDSSSDARDAAQGDGK